MKKAMTIISLAILLGAAGCAEGEYDETFELSGTIEKVVVDTSTGDIEIMGGDAGSATVSVEMSCKTAAPKVQVDLDGTTLMVTMDAGNGASACHGAFVIDAPAGAELELETGSGDIIVDGIDGDTEALTYDGDIEVADAAGDLQLTAVSGDVSGERLVGSECEVVVGSGDVELVFDETPEVVDVEVTSGNTKVVVPEGEYSIEAEAEAGEVEVDGVDELDSADNEILVTVTSGDIAINTSL